MKGIGRRWRGADMGDEAAARHLPEYRAALADLRHTVEAAGRPDRPTPPEAAAEARARVRRIERGGSPTTRVVARV